MSEAELDVSDFIGGGDESTPPATQRAQQRGLHPQALSDLEDLDSLGPTTLKIMSRQATLNVGTIGHVAHGKSTVVNAISGVKTTKFQQESVMNITIHLGYANAKIFSCKQCRAKQKKMEQEERERRTAAAGGHSNKKQTTMSSFSPDGVPGGCVTSNNPSGNHYYSFRSNQAEDAECPRCQSREMTLERHVSFLDCPGHEILMATMLNGAAIMDAALLLIAANEPFPQPQTREHLHAAEILNLPSLVILQNKIDLVTEMMAQAQYNDIKSYLRTSLVKHAPVIPICAQLGYQLDVVLAHIVHFPIPRRNLRTPARMIIVRSFDINNPGQSIDKLQGGVLGGTIQQGILRVGQEVEVRPGVIYTSSGEEGPARGLGQSLCYPLTTTITQLQAEANQLHYAIPGGLIAVGTKVDPALTRQNKLAGQVVGEVGTLPEMFVEITAQYFLLTHLVGMPNSTTHSKDGEVAHQNNKHRFGISRPSQGEALRLTIGAHTCAATVLMTRGELSKFALSEPVVCELGKRFCLSRMIIKQWRLIGWGTIKSGVPAQLYDPSNPSQ